jgi:lysophospholipase L1-like esterase
MRSYRCLVFLFALLVAALGGTTWAQGAFALRDGDRVVFYGDSITDQRLYTQFVEDYVVTRFPRMNVRFIHSGWGGDRVSGGGGGPIERRLDRDVIAYRPTVMTIMLGMNDASYRPYDAGIFRRYSSGYEQIVSTMKRAVPDLRLTLIQPSPFDDVTRAPSFEGGYNAVLVRYGEFIRQLGARQGATVADLNTPVVAALEKARDMDAENAAKIVPDRVHPGPAGHLLMATALLKAWNAPAVVSAVTIDAGSKQVTRQENTRVTGLRGDGSLTWTQKDDSLPMPLDRNDAVLQLALKASDVEMALDQQPLQVTGLMGARYTLKIDGEPVGTFTPEQLAEGVNLAALATPMTKQAAQVHALTDRHNDIHFVRWREVQVPLQDNSSRQVSKAIKALDALEEDLVKQQRAAAQPKTRRFELAPEG